jgi:hypothetical protein
LFLQEEGNWTLAQSQEGQRPFLLKIIRKMSGWYFPTGQAAILTPSISPTQTMGLTQDSWKQPLS